MEDTQVIQLVNSHSEIRSLERKLKFISARRKKGVKHAQKMSKLRRNP